LDCNGVIRRRSFLAYRDRLDYRLDILGLFGCQSAVLFEVGKQALVDLLKRRGLVYPPFR
jgi:hypothetical protein